MAMDAQQEGLAMARKWKKLTDPMHHTVGIEQFVELRTLPLIVAGNVFELVLMTDMPCKADLF